MIPKQYRRIAVVLHEAPYQLSDSQPQGPESGKGALQIGRVVWTERTLQPLSPNGPIPAYVDGIGIISLDPTCLTFTR